MTFGINSILKFFGGEGDLQADPYAIADSRDLIDTETHDDDARSDWWEIYPDRWYQVFPYQFVIMQRTGLDTDNPDIQELATYTLPIPPQAVNVRMVSASQVTPTMGGVVEETSANVFWEITLSGTTGTAIGKKGTLRDTSPPATHSFFWHCLRGSR